MRPDRSRAAAAWFVHLVWALCTEAPHPPLPPLGPQPAFPAQPQQRPPAGLGTHLPPPSLLSHPGSSVQRQTFRLGRGPALDSAPSFWQAPGLGVRLAGQCVREVLAKRGRLARLLGCLDALRMATALARSSTQMGRAGGQGGEVGREGEWAGAEGEQQEGTDWAAVPPSCRVAVRVLMRQATTQCGQLNLHGLAQVRLLMFGTRKPKSYSATCVAWLALRGGFSCLCSCTCPGPSRPSALLVPFQAQCSCKLTYNC